MRVAMKEAEADQERPKKVLANRRKHIPVRRAIDASTPLVPSWTITVTHPRVQLPNLLPSQP